MDTIYTWYGHATHGLRLGKYQLLIDPYFNGNPAASQTADQACADFILITHGHGDHVGDTLEIAKRCNSLCVSNSEICSWLRKQNLNTHAMHIGGGHEFPFGHLKMTQAWHGSALPDGSYGGTPGGFLLTTPDNKKIYFAGDTGLFGDMKFIGDVGLDLAVLPIGDNYTMGPDDALLALKLLQPKKIVPTHYNTWNLLLQDPFAWKKKVEAETSTEVCVLKPGESLNL